jgi:hypothetical protein
MGNGASGAMQICLRLRNVTASIALVVGSATK